MNKKPLQINDILPAMTSDYDIEMLAAELMPKVKGLLRDATGEVLPLRAITWSPYLLAGDGSVLLTEGRAGAFSGACVYAMYKLFTKLGDDVVLTLRICEDEATAERLARELRALVYGRERLAGRMQSRDDIEDTQ